MARTRRPGRRRKLKTTLLIVGEGKETEPNYFHGLKREGRVHEAYAVTVKRGNGGSRTQIVREAIDRRNERIEDYNETWCVMDVEKMDTSEARKEFAMPSSLPMTMTSICASRIPPSRCGYERTSFDRPRISTTPTP